MHIFLNPTHMRSSNAQGSLGFKYTQCYLFLKSIKLVVK